MLAQHHLHDYDSRSPDILTTPGEAESGEPAQSNATTVDEQMQNLKSQDDPHQPGQPSQTLAPCSLIETHVKKGALRLEGVVLHPQPWSKVPQAALRMHSYVSKCSRPFTLSLARPRAVKPTALKLFPMQHLLPPFISSGCCGPHRAHDNLRFVHDFQFDNVS
jgi:hypothetical protein